LFAMLEPELSSAVVISRIPAMLTQGWRCVGAYHGMDLVGMAGFSKRTHLFSGPVIYIENVAVLPGSFLARDSNGTNPGEYHVRIALVAELGETIEAAHRIAEFTRKLT